MNELTLDVVRRAVDNVLQMDRDHHSEAAHAEQDPLYVRVLRAVADGHPDGRAMARECLRIADSGAARWFS